MILLPFEAIFFTAWFFVVGSVVGSFLNVVILRGERRESLLGRSHCDTCDRVLAWKELIPIVSFVRQKGRCRHCRGKFSLQYPLVEVLSGLLFGTLAAFWLEGLLPSMGLGSMIDLLASLIALSAVIVVVVSDFRYYIIPNGAVIVLGCIGVVMALARANMSHMMGYDFSWFSWGPLLTDLLSSIAAMLFFGFLWFFSRGRWMGFGDIKLVGATSLIIGFPASVLAVLLAFWSGGAVGILLILFNRGSLKSHIPFGPFIILGAFFAPLFSDRFFSSQGWWFF